MPSIAVVQEAEAFRQFPKEAVWSKEAHVKSRRTVLQVLEDNRKGIFYFALTTILSFIAGMLPIEGFEKYLVRAIFQFGYAGLGTMGLLEFWKARVRRRVLGTLDDPEDEDQLLAEVGIYQDGLLTGSDVGTLTTIDHAIVFNGHATSFCIGSQDVFDHTPGIGKIEPGVRVRLKSEKDVFTIEMKWIGPDKIGVYRTLFGPYKTDLERRYPPRTLGRQISAPRTWKLIQLAFILTAIPMSAIFVGSATGSLIGTLTTIAALLALVTVWPKPRNIQRKLDLYKRLKAERDRALLIVPSQEHRE